MSRSCVSIQLPPYLSASGVIAESQPGDFASFNSLIATLTSSMVIGPVLMSRSVVAGEIIGVELSGTDV